MKLNNGKPKKKRNSGNIVLNPHESKNIQESIPESLGTTSNTKGRKKLKLFKYSLIFGFIIVLCIVVGVILVGLKGNTAEQVKDTTDSVSEEIEPTKEYLDNIEDFGTQGVVSIEERDKERKYHTYTDKYLDFSFELPDDYFITEKTHLLLDKLPSDIIKTKTELPVGLLHLSSKSYDDIQILFQLNHRKDYVQEEEITNSTETYVGKTIYYYNNMTPEQVKAETVKLKEQKKEYTDKINKAIGGKRPKTIRNAKEHSGIMSPYTLKVEKQEFEGPDKSKIKRVTTDLGFGSYSVYTEQKWSKPDQLFQSEYVFQPYYLAIDLGREYKEINDHTYNSCPTEGVIFLDEESIQDENIKTCINYSGKQYFIPEVVEETSQEVTQQEENTVETEGEPNTEEEEEENFDLFSGTFTQSEHEEIRNKVSNLNGKPYTLDGLKINAKRVDLLKNNKDEYIAYELSIPFGVNTLYATIISVDKYEIYYVLQDLEKMLSTFKVGSAYVNEIKKAEEKSE